MSHRDEKRKMDELENRDYDEYVAMGNVELDD